MTNERINKILNEVTIVGLIVLQFVSKANYKFTTLMKRLSLKLRNKFILNAKMKRKGEEGERGCSGFMLS